jgi:serine/threonine protein kinase
VSQKYERFGKYLMLEKLAMGGMAEIWLARTSGASGIGKFVAIKKILGQFSDNPEFIQMFKDEAAIAINLSHSNIVGMYEFGLENKQLFLVMDFVEGRNLRQLINKLKTTNQKFSTEQIVYMAKEIASGLDHAHRSLNATTGKPLNIIHRDMSPQNVMVSFEGEVKIVDFGIAKAESQGETTKTGTLKGKFGYMSPEQAEGQQTDLRTDVFSLGIVIWELLANERLFIANNELNTLKKIRDCQVPSLTKIDPNIHPELERIVMKALTRDRNLRYQTSAALHRDLNRFLNRQYPDFIPHEFSVFMKTLFAEDILSHRQKLIEYSKINIDDKNMDGSANETAEKTEFSVRSTPPQDDKVSEIFSATETFSSSSESGASTKSNSGVSLDPDSSNPQILNKNSLKGPVLDEKFIKRSLENRIRVNPSVPQGHSQDGGTESALSVESTFTPAASYARKTSRNETQVIRKKRSSNWEVIFFVAIAIVGYVGGTKYYPQEMQKLSNVLKRSFGGILKPAADLPMVNEITTALEGPISTLDLAASLPEDQILTGTKNLTAIVVNSVPAGAEIFINGQPSGNTPAQVSVPAEEVFSVELKLERYIAYKKENLSVAQTGKSFQATLQKAMVAYLNIDVRPPINAKVYVNGQLLKDEVLPITNYAVPANSPVVVQAVSTTNGAQAKETVTLKEDQKMDVILRLRGSASDTEKK